MFRRKKAGDADAPDGTLAPDDTDDTEGTGVPAATARGPWDASEVEIEEGDESRVDLGSLLIRPVAGLDVQLQVDEASEQVIAVILAGETGAVELRAFAAPRNGDIWADMRRQLAGEIARMGGTATEVQGAWGTEVRVSLAVTADDGQRAQQTSKVVGIPGPRWLLRATFFGRPALEHDEDGDVETALREVVVVRGTGPVPPGDMLPLTMPPNAQRA